MSRVVGTLFCISVTLILCAPVSAQRRVFRRSTYTPPVQSRPVYSQASHSLPIATQQIYSVPVQTVHSNAVQQVNVVEHVNVATSNPSVVAGASTTSTDPFRVCDCGNNPGGKDCDCKNLDCEIRLPLGCKKTRGPHKEPIPCNIIGTIPKRDITINCSKKVIDFLYPVNVPEIHCTTEKCTEIGKKRIECIPGCYFSVCIPINKCETETVECKLVKKRMKVEIWQRRQGGAIVFDVYVINVAPHIAGGMPERWLIMHCATAQQVRTRFPDAKRSDGSPLVKNVPKDAKPQKTDADISVELTVKQALVEHYVRLAEQASEDNDKIDASDTDSSEAAKSDVDRDAPVDGDILAAINRAFSTSTESTEARLDDS